MPQIGWRLALLRRHQEPVGAEEEALLADGAGVCVLRAQILAPERIWLRSAAVAFRHLPWPGQGIVDHGDLVTQDVAVGLVDVYALLHHRLVVRVQRQPGRVIGTTAFDLPRLDL